MQKSRKIYSLLLPLIAALTMLQGCQLMQFPGEISTPDYTFETDPDGIRSAFNDGEVYRYPEIMPMLSVSGSHYEMGLQYGVLLRPEILDSLENYSRLLKFFAQDEGIPFPLFTAFVKIKAIQISLKLPARFRDEIRGIAAGSGVPYDSILAISMFYDVLEAVGCTGILLKGQDNTVIHGRNQDWFALEELGDLSVVVEHNAEGYNSFTHIDWLLGLGVETGYNDEGLAFSEETVSVNKPNANGFSFVYLSRIALEECSNLDQVKQVFDRYSVIGGYGTVWSDRDEGLAMVLEASPSGWVTHLMEDTILWNFNHYYDESLADEHQPVWKSLSAPDWDREYIAAGFPRKDFYTVEDAVDFMRSQTAPDGNDYSWYGSTNPVCNDSGWQMIVFDPGCDGFYYAWGHSFAARRDCYRFHQDFTIQPEICLDGIPIDPMVEETARVYNSLLSDDEMLDAYKDLSEKYPDDANLRFWVAYRSFARFNLSENYSYAVDSYAMKPEVPEYGLYAGMAWYGQNDPAAAADVLEAIDTSLFTPLQEIYRLAVLERSYTALGSPVKSLLYRLQYEWILMNYDAQEYFAESILPKIDALDH